MKKILYILLFALCAPVLLAASGNSYYFQRAEEAYNKEDYETCLHYCKEGVKKDPKDGKCWAVIAEICSKRQFARYGEALQASEKALAVLPKKESWWRAFVYGIRGDVFYKIEDYQSSKQAYLTALSIQPDNTTILYDVADVCNNLGEYENVITYFKRIVDLIPSKVYIYGELANAYYKAGNKQEAQRYCDLTNALADGGNCQTHRVLSMLAVDKEDYITACREIARAMFCGQSWYEEADTLTTLCPDLLMAAIRTEVDDARTSAEANAVAGYCAYTMHRYMDALYYQHKQLEHSDSPQSAYAWLASLYDEVDEFETAKNYYLLTLKTDSVSDVWVGLAHTERRMGQYEQALTHFRRALQDSPTEGRIYYAIARCYIEKEEYAAALATFDTAQVLLEEEDWKLSLMHYQVECYRHLGDETKAQQVLDQAQRMRKTDDEREEFYMIDAHLGDTAALIRHMEVLEADKKADAGKWLTLSQAFAIVHDKARVMQALRRHYEAGEYAMRYPLRHYRYAFLRDDADFRAMIAHYDSLRLEQLTELQERLGARDTMQNKVTELPFTQQGGVNRVQCSINGLPLYFVFDTGATDVSISSVEASFMLKNGYLTNADFMGKQNYVTATGEIHEGTIINLREVRVGDVVLRDIKASVIKNQSAPLLLGQSCFRRFGTVEVDNNAQVIRLIAQ